MHYGYEKFVKIAENWGLHPRSLTFECNLLILSLIKSFGILLQGRRQKNFQGWANKKKKT